MTEPLFGSVSQFWPAMPGSSYGFMQSPMSLGARPLNPLQQGIQNPFTGGIGIQGQSPYSGGVGMQGQTPFSGGIGIQGQSPFSGGVGIQGQNPYSGSGGIQGQNPYSGGMATGQQTSNPGLGEFYMMGNPTTNVGTGLSAAIVPGAIGSFPNFTGTEIAIGVTAPALLATVAMRRGQPLGPTNDQEIEDFIYDALDLLPGASDVEVRCENGKATVTGSVPHKRLKRDVGELAWAIPSLNDVQNNITVTARRRSRSQQGRENEPQSVAARKQG
jgi:hypothetical protein